MPNLSYAGVSSTSGDRKLPAGRGKRKILFAHTDNRKRQDDGEKKPSRANSVQMEGLNGEDFNRVPERPNLSKIAQSGLDGKEEAVKSVAPTGKNTNSCVIEADRYASMKNSTISLASLRKLAAKETETSRNRHKDILFKMFVDCNEDDIEALTKKHCDANKIKNVILKSQRQRQSQTDSKIKLSDEEILPESLSVLQRLLKDQNIIGFSKLKKRRTDFAARTLKELEDEAMARFLKSGLNKSSSLTAGSTPGSASAKPPPTATATAPPSPAATAAATQSSGTHKEMEKEPINRREQHRNFKPFSLLYNECSIVSICRWAGQNTINGTKRSKEKILKTNPTRKVTIPTPRAAFRKCSICNLWGHYEIECQDMKSDDVMRIGRAAQIQLTTRDMVEGNTGTQSNWNRNGQKGLREHSCAACGTKVTQATLIPCFHCDKYWHYQCLDLEELPKEDWLCRECTDYDSDVSSTIKAEVCENFVIEQKKRPWSNGFEGGVDNYNGFDSSNGFDDVASDESLQAEDGNDSDFSVEETRLDDLLIKAKRSSEDLAPGRVSIGSVVIWFSHANSNAVPQEIGIGKGFRPGASGRLAIVLEMNSEVKKSLVQEISLSKERIISDNVSILPDTDVRWIATKKLHVIGKSEAKIK